MADTDGAFIWYELMTPDPVAAKAFYDPVVGWSIDDHNTVPGGAIDYRMIVRGDGGFAGGVLGLLIGGGLGRSPRPADEWPAHRRPARPARPAADPFEVDACADDADLTELSERWHDHPARSAIVIVNPPNRLVS